MSSYAQPTDLSTYGAPDGAFGDVQSSDVQAQLDAASTLADGYLQDRFTLPIKTVSADLVMAVCQIAAWNLLRRRGFNPEDPTGAQLRAGYEDAMSWLRDVAKGLVTPQLQDSSGAPAGSSYGGPFVIQPQQSGQVDGSGFPVLTTGAPRSRGW